MCWGYPHGFYTARRCTAITVGANHYCIAIGPIPILNLKNHSFFFIPHNQSFLQIRQFSQSVRQFRQTDIQSDRHSVRQTFRQSDNSDNSVRQTFSQSDNSVSQSVRQFSQSNQSDSQSVRQFSQSDYQLFNQSDIQLIS